MTISQVARPNATPPAREPSGAFVTVGAGGEVWPLPDPDTSFKVDTLEALAEEAARWGRWRHVWLTPAAVAWFGLDERRREPLELPGGMRVRSTLWEPGSPFAGIDDPLELYRQLWALEAALGGIPWYWGSGRSTGGAVTSDVLLRVLHRPPRARPIEPTQLPPPAVKKGSRAPGEELPFMWHRPPGPGDRGHWVHHYDLNAAYLAAASKLRLPQGPPLRLGPEGVEAARYPGYWLIQAEPWDITTLPDPIGRRPAREKETWVTTPTVRLLADIERRFEILDGWYWMRTCQALTPWYERLRDARANLTGPARLAVKEIYRHGIGRLGSEHRANPDDPLYQPAWAHHVIAEARARVFRRLGAIGRAVLAVETDGIWIQHEDPDPLAAAAEMWLPIGDGLGQWKPLGTLRAIDAHAVLTGPPRGVYARLKAAEVEV